MSIWDRMLDKLGTAIAARITIPENKPIGEARAYRQGHQRRPLKVGGNQYDDNIVINYTGLIANRIVSQMIGKGIELDFEGDAETAQEKWLTACLNANKQEILFHRALLAAGEAGTGYLYLMPGGSFDGDGNEYPRIQVVDPAFVRIETMPEDFEVVLRYVVEYNVPGPDGRDKTRRRVIEQDDGGVWFTRDYEQSYQTGGRWVVTQEVPFADAQGNAYPFPPMLHWQNLPTIDRPEGEPDITQPMIALQDRQNYLAANISKIIRYHAHPMRFTKMLGQATQVQVGPDELLNFNDPNGGVFQLEQLGDLASSLGFFKALKQSMFDCARVVDIDSLQDKLGSLTNFGLRVLYQDNLAMIATKRELFGDAVEDLASRLQVMGGFDVVRCTVVWPDMLPVNEQEQQQAVTGDLNAGLVSLDTARMKRGYDPEQEAERMRGVGQMMDKRFWEAMKAAMDAGISSEGYMRMMGIDPQMMSMMMYEGLPEQ